MITDLAEILALGEAQENGHICRYERFFATKPQVKISAKSVIILYDFNYN
jgi:hypothetical protein